MTEEIEKYLWDIKLNTDDIFSYVKNCESLTDFRSSRMIIAAVERSFEIIGEALKRIRDLDSSIVIRDASKIIGLRNLIAHAYDSVDATQLWIIVKNHLPKLKEEVEGLLGESKS